MKAAESRAILGVLVLLLCLQINTQGIWVSLASPERSGASLTGVVFDQGIDEDGDGTYDFLEIGVQVDVTQAAYYGVELRGLASSDSVYMDIRPDTYLEPREVGLQVFLIRVSGQWIHSFGVNPVSVSSISLRDLDNNPIEEIEQVPLSREYLYTEFDSPGATLTGVILDRGVDEDGDGTYDFLEIGVQVNVTREAQYRIDVSGAQWTGYAWGPGVQTVNVTINGQMISVSGLNLDNISFVSLSDENGNILWRLEEAPLSREYLYTEFDVPGALLTGTIYDSGVDEDGDGTFDYLEVSVEINVTRPGEYYVGAWELQTDESEPMEGVGGSNYQFNVSVGVHVWALRLDGSTIYSSGLNPVGVSNLEISGDYRAYSQVLTGIPLSRRYLYTEFDRPQVSPGDWAKYTMDGTWHSTDPSATEPDQIKQQRDVEWMKIEIQEVYGPQITLSQTYLYENGTETRQKPVSGNMNYQFLTYIVPSDIEKGGSIPGSYVPFNVHEVQGTYAGMERDLTYGNLTLSFFGMNATIKAYWDRSTGVLCEMNTTITMQWGDDLTTQSSWTRMTETNLWKRVTHLSCSVSEDTVKEGGSITVSGSIDAGLPGIAVAVTYRKPDGSTLNRTVTTGSNGAYSDSLAVESVGSWSVSASWEGDTAHTGSTSLLKPFTVTPKPFLETPLGMAAAGAAIIVAVLVVVLLRRKGA
jgi:hypothetical protein